MFTLFKQLFDGRSTALITDPIAVTAAIMLVPAFFMWLERRTKWKIFEYLPAIVWIFIFPIILSNIGIIPTESSAYTEFKKFAVPLFIIIMLLDVDIRSAFKVAWRATAVLLFGAFGVVIGAAIATLALKPALPLESWTGLAALAGSWIGGTGNLAAVAEGLHTPPEMTGMAVIADTIIYIIWFPLLLACKRWARGFNRFAKVTDKHSRDIEKALEKYERKEDRVHFYDLLTLAAVGFIVIAAAKFVADMMPELPPILTAKTWMVLIVTTVGLLLAMTPLRKVPGTGAVSLFLVYVYMSMIGAEADLAHLANGVPFLIASALCMIVHGLFCILGARIFHVDIHLTAVASAANIGGAASAPVVAAYHNRALVPVSILMALIGYAVGNYLGFLTGHICYLILS
jgi:uncharacterized membrane protein